MKCFYCDNNLKSEKITYNINRKGYDVILRDVPAYVCQECGQVFFEEKGVESIQSLISDLDKKSDTVKHHKPYADLKLAL